MFKQISHTKSHLEMQNKPKQQQQQQQQTNE